MFAIYRKNVGGRIHDRYFKDYDKAKAELKRDVDAVVAWAKEHLNYDIKVETIDRMNVEKGFYEYEVRWTNMEGEAVSHAIVDGYFEDNPNA